ncbi:DUF3000 domain-containing protein [Spongisporangium articulatum]|uniref:DUF3000 domain-containing protein n=1 Tax=Spongisporangium articulatum TaxID=3362603 RepID=A0ABW8AS66_9ACTN
MAVREIPSGAPEAFLRASAEVRASVSAPSMRPEVEFEEVPAPQRIAPYALALSADVVLDDEELATGRFVLLHDPSEPESWEGPFRIVSFVKAALEPEMGADPMLGQVGWSWLTDALADDSAGHLAAGGTVTRVLSETFGELAGPAGTVDIEIRASWTPLGPLGAHLTAWATLLCTVAGLPPLPPGVTALRR